MKILIIDVGVQFLEVSVRRNNAFLQREDNFYYTSKAAGPLQVSQIRLHRTTFGYISHVSLQKSFVRLTQRVGLLHFGSAQNFPLLLWLPMDHQPQFQFLLKFSKWIPNLHRDSYHGLQRI
jgi:hypothetical protein